jgi:hypothetical protein
VHDALAANTLVIKRAASKNLKTKHQEESFNRKLFPSWKQISLHYHSKRAIKWLKVDQIEE